MKPIGLVAWLFDAVVVCPVMSNAIGGSNRSVPVTPTSLRKASQAQALRSEGYATRDEEPEWSGP